MLRKFTRKQATAGVGAIPRNQPNTDPKHTNAMKPLAITITTGLAEQICQLLETLASDHDDTLAGILVAEIRGMIAADVEAPEPPPEPDEIEPGLDVPEPEEREVEYPEPAPDEREVEDDDAQWDDDDEDAYDPYGRIGIGDGLD